MGLFWMDMIVGHTGFEPVTNGLKETWYVLEMCLLVRILKE